ncbi:MAG: hypothetical protein RL064_1312 [Bacteroidota bacterium]
MQEKVKYLIVGQGLVGTWLSYFLQQRQLSFKIINDNTVKAATSIASGVINPVTGRRIVQTWMIDSLLPFAVQAYKAFGETLGTEIIKKAPAILLHPSEQMKESFEYRLSHENVYLFKNDPEIVRSFFNTPYGTGAIDECYWIDLNKMLSASRLLLQQNENYIECNFSLQDLTFNEKGVIWQNIQAEYIIFCDGIHAMHNNYFNKLPFAPNKGEALIIKVPGLPTNHIYKTNISIIPWVDDLFWVGSSYEWSFDSIAPTLEFREKMKEALGLYLKLPFEVVDHIVGVRPANRDRRPFVGMHPIYPQIGICNGMGTKGCSLAPYFTNQLIDHLELGLPIEPEANINRFQNLLVS